MTTIGVDVPVKQGLKAQYLLTRSQGWSKRLCKCKVRNSSRINNALAEGMVGIEQMGVVCWSRESLSGVQMQRHNSAAKEPVQKDGVWWR